MAVTVLTCLLMTELVVDYCCCSCCETLFWKAFSNWRL